MAERELAQKKIQQIKSDSSYPENVKGFLLAVFEQTLSDVTYDPTYRSISYPMRDVPAHTGVCTDVVIRGYRALGWDLQELVHEDMRRNFSKYPKIWGLKKPDPNIDHRRVPNLRVYFQRQNASLKISDKAEDYEPGDLITCTVPPHLPHIAVVVPSPYGSQPPWIVHNIGRGPKYENRLFEFPITGHYRWFPSQAIKKPSQN